MQEKIKFKGVLEHIGELEFVVNTDIAEEYQMKEALVSFVDFLDDMSKYEKHYIKAEKMKILGLTTEKEDHKNKAKGFHKTALDKSKKTQSHVKKVRDDFKNIQSKIKISDNEIKKNQEKSEKDLKKYLMRSELTLEATKKLWTEFQKIKEESEISGMDKIIDQMSKNMDEIVEICSDETKYWEHHSPLVWFVPIIFFAAGCAFQAWISTW